MSEAKDLTEIRNQIQQRSAEQKLTQRSTMSVPEMRKLLGLKKTDSYWLVHKNLFKTQIIGGMMRIDLESFEKWYANQVKYKKVGGEEPGKELREKSYSFKEAANILGIHDSNSRETGERLHLFAGCGRFAGDFAREAGKDCKKRRNWKTSGFNYLQ